MFKILNRIYQKFQKIRKKRKRGSKSRPYSAFRFLAKRGRNVATEANFLSYFTLNQMYRHNLQFGTLLELSYWTSLWFILGLRGRFTVIDLNWSMLYFRKALVILCGLIAIRRHVCLVNDHVFMFDHLEYLTSISGETFFSGRWFGGSFTNFKKMWRLIFNLIKLNLKFRTTHQFKIFRSLFGIRHVPTLPGMVIINSAKRSFVACSEARALSLPTFATLDSDYVALNAFYPLPSNDDSTGSFYFYNHIAMKTALLMKVYSLLKRKKEKILFEYKFWVRRNIGLRFGDKCGWFNDLGEYLKRSFKLDNKFRTNSKRKLFFFERKLSRCLKGFLRSFFGRTYATYGFFYKKFLRLKLKIVRKNRRYHKKKLTNSYNFIT